jgi:hypothetical protein
MTADQGSLPATLTVMAFGLPVPEQTVLFEAATKILRLRYPEPTPTPLVAHLEEEEVFPWEA